MWNGFEKKTIYIKKLRTENRKQYPLSKNVIFACTNLNSDVIVLRINKLVTLDNQEQ